MTEQVCDCGQPARVLVSESICDEMVTLYAPPKALCGECLWRWELDGVGYIEAAARLLPFVAGGQG